MNRKAGQDGLPGLPGVLAIVLNYNGREMTLSTVASLLALDYPALEILVVDNGSSDGSVERLEAAHPRALSCAWARTPDFALATIAVSPAPVAPWFCSSTATPG